jgi:hypothetical protein
MWPQPALAKQVLEQEYVTVSGPDEARKTVRENLAIGAGLIKIVIDAGAGDVWKSRCDALNRLLVTNGQHALALARNRLLGTVNR